MWNSIRYYWERYLFWSVLLVLAVGVLRWDWHLTVWDWFGETNGSETNSSTFRNFGLIILPVVAIYLTWKRIKIAAREARTSRDNLRTARDALQQSEKTLSYTVHKDEVDRLHGRYADASARLSNDSVSARLGAIYELQVLTAQDPQQLHIQTMKLLCPFVRFPPPEARFDDHPDGDPCSHPLRPDVQAAMEVIGSRTEECIELEKSAKYRPDLRQANLVRLELRNGNLSRIDMRGTKFWGADLVDADLSQSRLQHAEFSSPWVLRGVEIDELIVASDGYFEAREAVQSNITYMTGVNLSGALMLSAKLRGADMSNANLPDVDMSSASLEGANFSEAELVGADMSEAKLASADLTGSKMYNLILSGTDLKGSNAENSAHGDPPTGLTQAQLDQACADLDNPPKLDESSDLVWNSRQRPRRAR